jgi:hypothetical protein
MVTIPYQSIIKIICIKQRSFSILESSDLFSASKTKPFGYEFYGINGQVTVQSRIPFWTKKKSSSLKIYKMAKQKV